MCVTVTKTGDIQRRIIDTGRLPNQQAVQIAGAAPRHLDEPHALVGSDELGMYQAVAQARRPGKGLQPCAHALACLRRQIGGDARAVDLVRKHRAVLGHEKVGQNLALVQERRMAVELTTDELLEHNFPGRTMPTGLLGSRRQLFGQIDLHNALAAEGINRLDQQRQFQLSGLRQGRYGARHRVSAAVGMLAKCALVMNQVGCLGAVETRQPQAARHAGAGQIRHVGAARDEIVEALGPG